MMLEIQHAERDDREPFEPSASMPGTLSGVAADARRERIAGNSDAPVPLDGRLKDMASHDVAAPLQVELVARISGMDVEQRCPEITVLIPGEDGAFHAQHRTRHGRLQQTFVRAPQVAVIPPNRPYAVSCDVASDLVRLRLDPGYFESRARALDGGAVQLVERYAAVDTFLREVGNTVRVQLSRNAAWQGDYLEALAGVIALHLAQNYTSNFAPGAAYVGLAPHKLKRVVRFVEEHIGENLSVRLLAGTVHMSPFHFARMFRKATGQPPHLFVTMRRIERARRLLAAGTISLGDVGAAVGFQTQSYFTDVFRRHTGVTPGVYRTQLQQTEEQIGRG